MASDYIFSKNFLKPLLVTSLLELIIVRILSRLGMHIPKELSNENLTNYFFKTVSTLGLMIYYCCYALAFLSISLIIYYKLKSKSKLDLAISFLLLFLLISSLYFQLNNTGGFFALIYDLASIATILILPISSFAKCQQFNSRHFSQKLCIILIFISYLCYFYFKTSYGFYQFLEIPLTPVLVIEAFNLGELLAVINCLVIFIAYSRFSSCFPLMSIIFSSFLTALFISAYLISPYTISILSIWSLGFTLYLPFPLYAAAIWLFTFTVIRCLYEGEYIGYGLAFIFIAGYTISQPHQLLMAILGVFFVNIWNKLEVDKSG